MRSKDSLREWCTANQFIIYEYSKTRENTSLYDFPGYKFMAENYIAGYDDLIIENEFQIIKFSKPKKYKHLSGLWTEIIIEDKYE